MKVGMFPLILTVLSRDSSRGHYHPDEGLLEQGGMSPDVGATEGFPVKLRESLQCGMVCEGFR